MIYAVNNRTKEHRILDEQRPVPCQLPPCLAEWELVEADSDGWIPWDACEGAKSPFIGNRTGAGKAKMRLADGDIVDSVLHWDDRPMERRRVIAYRPILCDEGGSVARDGFDAAVERDEIMNGKAGLNHGPKEWSGEGLPPIGAEVEFASLCDAGEDDECTLWESARVVGYDGPAAVVAIDGVGYAGSSHLADFRPIRTAAQRAEKYAIEAMSMTICESHPCMDVSKSDDGARYLYAAIREGRIPGVKLEG